MSQVQVYEGYVTAITYRGPWLLIFTGSNRKPIAFKQYTGRVPMKGEKVSVEANEGAAWYFPTHRDAAIISPEGTFDVEGLSNYEGDRNGVVIALILRHLQSNTTVCSDDIHDKAVIRFPDVNPSFIGHGFRTLAKRNMIHRLGYKRSTRTETDHAREIAIWELTKKS